ncbi:MAG TPA: MBL fold metallo-hydrolase [Syntrophomonadaceae bacterium]|nr:MBL fold metallo-hydrolase [Syntrophomonadaceae bacterium]
MVQEAIKGLYRISVPLPNNPLKSLNSYLIKGQKRSLLIDTGFNLPECKRALLEGIEALHLDWSKIDFFITHFHADHSGLIKELARRGATTYCSEVDARIMEAAQSSNYWEQVILFYSMHGYPKEEMEKQRKALTDNLSKKELHTTYVKEGEILGVGDYLLSCISTPGHTPGHMCLYEPKSKFLISGDHIIADITSNITARFDFHDSLGWYLWSLNKIDLMEINMVLPGHREIINDCHKRISELKVHHKSRLDEVRFILHQSGPMSGYQAASQMHWDMPYSSWEEVPGYQKWFATGEAIAHLENLAEQGLVQRIRQGEMLAYVLL